MKPIPSPYDKEALNLLNKAERLLAKAEELDMVEHEGKKVPTFAADGKGANDAKKDGEKKPEKDEVECDKCKGKGDDCNCDDECPECGNAMNKMGCKMGSCGMKMEKSAEAGSQPGFATSFDSKPAGVMFMAESGGQTRNAYYTTNQYPYNGEDVTNKGSTSESVNFENLGQQMNPHHDSVPRQVENGTLSKAEEALAKAKDDLTKALCEQCGGNQFTGCRFGFGPECPGLEGTTEMGEGESRDSHPSEYMRGRY